MSFALPLAPNEAAAVAYAVSLVNALTDAKGNIRQAAAALEMSEHTLRHHLKALDLVEWNRKAHPLSVRQPAKAGAKATSKPSGDAAEKSDDPA